MKLSEEEVEHVAKLARLEITESEKEAFSQHLSAILTYVDQLRAVETKGIDPTATVVEQANVFREDCVQPSLPVEKALANAPEAQDGCFVVPKIIEAREG